MEGGSVESTARLCNALAICCLVTPVAIFPRIAAKPPDALKPGTTFTIPAIGLVYRHPDQTI